MSVLQMTGFAVGLLGAGFATGRALRHRNNSSHHPESEPETAALHDHQTEGVPWDRLSAFMAALHDCGVSPSGRILRQEFAHTIVDAASDLLDAENVLWLELDKTTLELVAKAARGVSPEILSSLRANPGEGLLGRAAQSRTPVVVYGHDNVIAAMAHERFLTAPYIVLPVQVHSRLSGLLVMWKPRRGLFSSGTSRVADLLAIQAGRTLENLDLAENLQHFYDEMVQSLARALEVKDAYTHRHSDRTRALARAMGQEIHLPEQMIQQIERGALLHDIGKIGIEESILRKPGKLTEEEYTSMKRHSEMGYRILMPVAFFKPVSFIVLYHQEWYNGKGYHEGLTGDEIPLGARVVSIIDAWDAMTSDRSYRKAMPKAAATAELRRQAGTQFDPKLVDAFLHVIDRLEREGIPTTEQKPEEVRA